jgi:hypothetical protein
VLVDALPTKFAWKRGINLNIAEKWTNKLSEEIGLEEIGSISEF